jgi:hypothetical protein
MRERKRPNPKAKLGVNGEEAERMNVLLLSNPHGVETTGERFEASPIASIHTYATRARSFNNCAVFSNSRFGRDINELIKMRSRRPSAGLASLSANA